MEQTMSTIEACLILAIAVALSVMVIWERLSHAHITHLATLVKEDAKGRWSVDGYTDRGRGRFYSRRYSLKVVTSDYREVIRLLKAHARLTHRTVISIHDEVDDLKTIYERKAKR